MTDWIKALMRREFRLRPKTLPPINADRYHFHQGSVPILLSASHSTHHIRNGRRKYGEAFTAGFAQLIAEQSGAHAFYPLYQQGDDPNFSAESPYKQHLATLIKQFNIRFVLDIHGCANRHNIGLALGTMMGRTCPTVEPILIEHFRASGWQSVQPARVRTLHTLHPHHFVVNLPKFAGGLRQQTVTRYVAETLHVESAQLEICSTLRVPFERIESDWFEGDQEKIIETLQMLIASIGPIASGLTWCGDLLSSPHHASNQSPASCGGQATIS